MKKFRQKQVPDGVLFISHNKSEGNVMQERLDYQEPRILICRYDSEMDVIRTSNPEDELNNEAGWGPIYKP